MTDTERQEFQQMGRDIALLKQSQEKIVEPTLASINRKLDTLSFYTKDEIDSKLKSIQKRRWHENTISALAGSVLTSVVAYIVLKVLGDK